MAKKTLILLLVLIAPFTQARAVLLCAMMNQAPVEHCSCPSEHHRASAAQVHQGCCTLVMEVGAREFVPPALHASDATPHKQSWDQVPVVDVTPIVEAAVDVAPAPPRSALIRNAHPPLPLYLATARLRL